MACAVQLVQEIYQKFYPVRHLISIIDRAALQEQSLPDSICAVQYVEKDIEAVPPPSLARLVQLASLLSAW